MSRNGASDEARTRYLHLGKVALYQMSYTRNNSDYYNRESKNVKYKMKKFWGNRALSVQRVNKPVSVILRSAAPARGTPAAKLPTAAQRRDGRIPTPGKLS